MCHPAYLSQSHGKQLEPRPMLLTVRSRPPIDMLLSNSKLLNVALAYSLPIRQTSNNKLQISINSSNPIPNLIFLESTPEVVGLSRDPPEMETTPCAAIRTMPLLFDNMHGAWMDEIKGTGVISSARGRRKKTCTLKNDSRPLYFRRESILGHQKIVSRRLYFFMLQARWRKRLVKRLFRGGPFRCRRKLCATSRVESITRKLGSGTVTASRRTLS